MADAPPPQALSSSPSLGRRFVRLVFGLAMLGALLFGAAAVYFSSVIGSDALAVEPLEPQYTTKVATVEDDVVFLDPDGGQPAVSQDGVFGLRWADGVAEVGAILESTDSQNLVARRLVEGTDGPPVKGTLSEVTNAVFEGDPRQALGLSFAEVDIDGELGAMPAYLVPGESRTWVIYVHGKGSARNEGYRALRTLTDLGHPGLLITYRGDPEAPQDPSAQYGYGLREWKDLEAAVQYALDNGADDVVLAGWSMGGAITGQFLVKSALARDVRAVILDSPALDLPAALRLGASQRSLPLTPFPIPDLLTSAAIGVADLRYPTNVSDAVSTDPVVSFPGPVFIAHGTDDDVTPVSVSDDVVERRGSEDTTYVRVEGAAHTAAWNTRPAAYDLELATFARTYLR